MRFSFAESMCDPKHLTPLAIAADQAGYSSFTIPDSICFPAESDTSYPYTEDGDRAFLEDQPFIEPFTLIPALAAVTEKLRFTTFVMKLPIRLPVIVAKSAASVAVMSDNRFGFGIGLSPWPEDFAVTGQAWKGRGARMDEMIEIIWGLTAGGFFEFHGKYYDIPKMKICPVPTEPIPLLIGGHSEPALKRAARVSDGWMHAGGDPEELARCLGRIQELRREYGREKEPFELHVISLDAYTLDGIKRMEDQGITDAIVGFRNAYQKDTHTLQQKLDALNGYADNIISKL